MVKPSPSSQEPAPILERRPIRPFQEPVAWLKAFWKFSRPHTIIGTSLSVMALCLIALSAHFASASVSAELTPWPNSWPLDWLIAWVACLCGNVYIVGLNQVEDIAIDRINKPQLPIASGEFTKKHGQQLVLLMGIGAIALSLLSQNLFLILTVGLSLIIGTAYSLPPIRLKRFPFWASVCILAVRGAIVNLGLYLYFAAQFGLGVSVPARIWALMLFVLVFSFVIAIFKDIPDLEGDRQFNIATYTVQLGRKKVFAIARWVLTVCYGALIFAAPFLPGVNAPFLIATHSLGILSFWWLSRRVDLDSAPVKKDISYPTFYQFIWKLFFVEYLIFSMACWLAL